MRDKNKRNLEARYLAATIMKLTDNENKKSIEKIKLFLLSCRRLFTSEGCIQNKPFILNKRKEK